MRTAIFQYLTLLAALCLSVDAAVMESSKTRSSTAKSASGPPRLTVYVAEWDIPKKILWAKIDHVNYAFGNPTKDGKIQFDKAKLKNIVTEGHKNKKTVSLSVGGWSSSMYFSTLVGDAKSRDNFAKNIVQTTKEYDLDGIDIDWEYPNNPNGVACNANNPKDTENYLTFVQLLRKQLDSEFKSSRKLITAATATTTFNDASQKPLTDMKAWANAFDAINLMVYDVNGPWGKTTGANAAIQGGAPSMQSAESAIKAWSDAGIPKERLVLGVPFYGHSYKTTKPITSSTGISVPIDTASPQVKGDKYDDLAADPCPGAKKAYGGTWQWRTIKSDGVEDKKGGWTTYFDKESSTPYAYNAKTKVFLSYDNPKSMIAKADYVNQQKIGGVMVWSLEMDDQSNSLLNALQSVRKNE